MASQDRATDDDHVAQLLAKEAKEASKRYSELGVRALLPTRPTTAAPKPNTRFLKTIIRETDSHNLALKKKEELEARVRLRLRTVNNGEPATADRRGYGDEGHRKRRRVEEEAEEAEEEDDGRDRNHARKRRSRERHDTGSAERSRSPKTDDERRRTRHRTRRRSREIYGGGVGYRRGKWRHYEEQHGSGDREKRSRRVRDVRDEEERSRSHHTRRRRRSSSRESKISDGESHDRHRRRKERGHRTHRARSSPPPDMSRSPRRQDRWPRSRTPPGTGGGNGVARKNGTSLAAAAPDSDSDPLEALVGPLPPSGTSTALNDPPPLRSRGRGAYKPSASAMDQHFSATYDPSLDLRPDSEGPEGDEEKEDWDMALEALRDREIWKQKGAERLRAAGFGDEEIRKWEDSGREKGAEDVKWTRKGEAREWDRGKVVEEAAAAGGSERKGQVGLEEAWKRKDGGFLKNFKKALG